jgi:hypothetical protein
LLVEQKYCIVLNINKTIILYRSLLEWRENGMYRRNFRINKKQSTALTFIMLLTMTALLFTYLPSASAEDVIDTYAFISAAPNPVGVRQPLGIALWINEVPPSAGGAGGDRWQNMTVTVTKPDGTTDKLGPFTSDPVGNAWTIYIPTTLGTYYFQSNFQGQSFPNRTIQISPYMAPVNLPAATYKPSTSVKVAVTVQNQSIAAYPNFPLPTGYWQRPINSENTQWYQIAGSWLLPQYDAAGNRFNAYSAAPNTNHILWTKPIAYGGIVGGSTGDFSYYEGETYEPQLLPPIIMNGVLYYNTPNPPRIGFRAVDLHTGADLWFANGSSTSITLSNFYVKRWGDISLGQLLDMETPNQHGIIPYLWGIDSSGIATMPLPVTYHMYDAFTGNLILDMVNASAGTVTYGPSGELLVYILNGGASWLCMWNSTKAIPMADVSSTGAWQWRPDLAKVLDWRAGIQWNVTIPAYKDPYPQTLAKLTPDVIVATTGTNYYKIGSQMEIGYSTKTGEKLWAQNRTFPVDTAFGLIGPAGEGVYTEFQKQTMQWYAYDLNTGNKVWGPTDPYTSGWGMYYGGQSGGSALIAYGKLYATAYDGMIHAYDIKTGKHLWDFSTGSSGLETVYGTYPLSSVGFSIADGKLYVCSGEHSPSMPLWRGGGMWCVDAQNGSLLWKITGWFGYPVIADGYLVALNAGDMQLYCFGKGQTATEVSAPDVATPKGAPVMIKGAVTDQSPGTTCLGIPTAGTPAVSEESMSSWMDYLYLQRPMPTNTTGVTVHLTVIDPNNNFQEIGTVKSDAKGNYATSWNPPVPGLYKVTATFAGSNSYFSSDAETSFVVSAATAASVVTPSPSQTVPTSTITQTISPSPSPAVQPPTSGMPTMTYIAIGAAVAIIVAVAAALILRRRK